MNTNKHSKELKILVAGSVGSGKTTSINAVCEAVIGTEAAASERDALHRKETTTIAMEYGVVFINGCKIHLYGTPGQRRFEFMGSLLCKGAAGIVVMIDNGADNPIEELDYYLKQYAAMLKTKPAIIAVTHYDDTRTRTGLMDYHQYCIAKGFEIPVLRLDAREKSQVERTLQRLLSQIEGVSQRAAANDEWQLAGV